MKTMNLTRDPNPGLSAAREGRVFYGYVDEKTGIDSESVLTDSTFIQVIENGKRLVMKSFSMHLSTDSDSATVEFVTTAGADGSGQITVQTPKYRLDSGAALAQISPHVIYLDPPLVVTREDGQALSAQVLGNDAAAALTLGIYGWEEDDE